MTSSQSKSDQPYDEFYASIKLVSGEEILAMVVVDNTDKEKPEEIVIDNPVICKEIRANGTNIPWRKTTFAARSPASGWRRVNSAAI